MASLFSCCFKNKSKGGNKGNKGKKREKGINGNNSVPVPDIHENGEAAEILRQSADEENEDGELGDFGAVQRETEILRSYRKPPPPKNRARQSRAPRAAAAVTASTEELFTEEADESKKLLTDFIDSNEVDKIEDVITRDASKRKERSSMLDDIEQTLASLHGDQLPEGVDLDDITEKTNAIDIKDNLPILSNEIENLTSNVEDNLETNLTKKADNFKVELNDLKAKTDTAKNEAEKKLLGIKSVVENKSDDLQTNIEDSQQKGVSVIQGQMGDLKNNTVNTIASTTLAFGNVKHGAELTKANIQNTIGETEKEVKAEIDNVKTDADSFKAKAETTINKTEDKVKQGIENIKTEAETMKEVAEDKIVKTENVAKKEIGNLKTQFENLKLDAQDKINTTENAATQQFDAFKTDVKSKIAVTENTAKEKMDNLKTDAENEKSQVENSVKQEAENLKSKAENLKPNAEITLSKKENAAKEEISSLGNMITPTVIDAAKVNASSKIFKTEVKEEEIIAGVNTKLPVYKSNSSKTEKESKSVTESITNRVEASIDQLVPAAKDTVKEPTESIQPNIETSQDAFQSLIAAGSDSKSSLAKDIPLGTNKEVAGVVSSDSKSPKPASMFESTKSGIENTLASIDINSAISSGVEKIRQDENIKTLETKADNFINDKSESITSAVSSAFSSSPKEFVPTKSEHISKNTVEEPRTQTSSLSIKLQNSENNKDEKKEGETQKISSLATEVQETIVEKVKDFVEEKVSSVFEEQTPSSPKSPKPEVSFIPTFGSKRRNSSGRKNRKTPDRTPRSSEERESESQNATLIQPEDANRESEAPAQRGSSERKTSSSERELEESGRKKSSSEEKETGKSKTRIPIRASSKPRSSPPKQA